MQADSGLSGRPVTINVPLKHPFKAENGVDEIVTKRRRKVFAFKLLTPTNGASAIIGKGGSGIESIQRETGANVKISHNGEVYEGTEMRICLITSDTSAGMLAALKIVVNKILMAAQRDGEPQLNLAMLITSGIASKLIGKGGRNIAVLRSQYACRISIDKNIGAEQVLRIAGGEESLRQIMCEIWNCAQDEDIPDLYFEMNTRISYKYGARMDGPEYISHVDQLEGWHQLIAHNPGILKTEIDMEMAIPDHMVGRLIGKAGSVIAEISHLSGCRLKFSETRRLRVWGDFLNVQIAQSMVNLIMFEESNLIPLPPSKTTWFTSMGPCSVVPPPGLRNKFLAANGLFPFDETSPSTTRVVPKPEAAILPLPGSSLEDLYQGAFSRVPPPYDLAKNDQENIPPEPIRDPSMNAEQYSSYPVEVEVDMKFNTDGSVTNCSRPEARKAPACAPWNRNDLFENPVPLQPLMPRHDRNLFVDATPGLGYNLP